jgi:hypothetical protein
LLFLGQGSVRQPPPNTLTERFQVCPDFLGGPLLAVQARQLFQLGCQSLPPAGDLVSPLFQLRQVDNFGLVGGQQALLLSFQTPQLRLPFLLFSPLIYLLSIGLSSEGLELLQQCGGGVEQTLDVAPHSCLQFVRLDPTLRTTVLPIATDAVLAVALVVSVLRPARRCMEGDTKHRQATGLATEQAAEQVVVPRVVPEGQDRVPRQLRQGLVMGWFVDNGGDRDRDPLLTRTGAAASRLPGSRALRTRTLGHVEGVAVVVAGAGVNGIREDAVDDRTGPETPTAARPPRARCQTLEDLADSPSRAASRRWSKAGRSSRAPE